MKRDFELVRKILFKVEALPAGEIIEDLSVENYDDDTVSEHTKLLIEANLIQGRVLEYEHGTLITVQRLTWDGHDFIEAAAKDTLWEKAKSKIKEAGSAMTVEVLKEALKAAAVGAIS